ncbi:MAG: hypothetical protein IPO98_15535 [Saprospiraceae bacterium]|nr:hypothetical protein [Saprospiraceae bacterium]
MGHQYTPGNFKMDNLKLNDRAKSTLLQATKDAGLYANLCLITSYKIGTPVYYDDDDCDEIDEVLDEGVSLELWADRGYPELKKFNLEDEDILAPFSYENEEPIGKNSGYMGNYGPDSYLLVPSRGGSCLVKKSSIKTSCFILPMNSGSNGHSTIQIEARLKIMIVYSQILGSRYSVSKETEMRKTILDPD